MSKPQTGRSGTAQADRKEKASPLGDDMDKEIGSWKYMSAIEDDPVDFNLEAFPKGLKNAFNNDNLDMDFSIGGDFGKMSSFNVGMEDFDFSSPVKKNAKPKDKAREESSSGKVKAKSSSCCFSFDFDELDDFGYGSSLTKGEKKSNSLEHQSTVADGQEDWITDGKLTEAPQLEPLAKSKEENTKSMNSEKQIDFQTQSNFLEQQREKSNANPAQIESNMVGDSSSPAGRSSTEKYRVSGNVELQTNNTDISCHVNPLRSTEQSTKSNTKESVNPKVVAPSMPSIPKTHVNPLGATGQSTKSSTQENVNPKVVAPSMPSIPKTHVNPLGATEQSTNPSTQENVNLKVVATSMPSIPKTLSVERNPLSSLKAAGKAPDLSSLKISGLMGAKSGQLSSSFRNEPKSSMNLKVHSKVDESLSSEMTHLTDTEKQTPMTPPMKRKTCEAPNTECATLNPPKRLSVSFRDEISYHVNSSSSTQQASKSSIQGSVNPKVIAPSMASIQKSPSIERNFPSLKAASKMPDLSRFKISGLTEAKSGLSNLKLKVHPKVDEKSSSEFGHSTDTEKGTPMTPSLTRKTREAPLTDLAVYNPPKHVSPSPRGEIRVKEVSSSVQQQGSKLENTVNSNIKNPVCDPLTSMNDLPRELDMMEIEIPLVLETDANIEKAESYMKELDDICNMIKKKHEEAKEILVRAVINNNTLLMLNHPIIDEKIRTALKISERLMQMEIVI